MKIVVNDQVHLSEFRPSDKPALIEHLNDRDIYDRTLRIPFPYTDADADEWLVLAAEITKKQGRPVHWAIRSADDSLIGGCGFDGFEVGKSHRGEVGYWLAKPFWGRGIMTAVVQRVCQHAFEEFELMKVTPTSSRITQHRLVYWKNADFNRKAICGSTSSRTANSLMPGCSRCCTEMILKGDEMSWASQYISRLQDGETVQFRPRGNSMKGKVESGQLCMVEPVDPASLKVGDIVLCKVNGKQYLHLVKAIQGKRFQIGNNRGRINGWVGENSIFGICTRIE